MFADSLSMLNYVIQNNPYILECVKISLVQFLAEDPQPLKAVLDFLDGLYAGIFSKVACQGCDEFGPDKLKRNL
jgi:hypothetical protein